jgi:hypothetical protein
MDDGVKKDISSVMEDFSKGSLRVRNVCVPLILGAPLRVRNVCVLRA